MLNSVDVGLGNFIELLGFCVCAFCFKMGRRKYFVLKCQELSSCSAVILLFLVLPFPIALQEKKCYFLSWTNCWEEE